MSEDFVAVRNCNWLHEAELVRSVLAADGIDAHIPDQHTLGVQPLYGAAIGGVRVVVRAEDLERARAVLNAVLVNPAPTEEA